MSGWIQAAMQQNTIIERCCLFVPGLGSDVKYEVRSLPLSLSLSYRNRISRVLQVRELPLCLYGGILGAGNETKHCNNPVRRTSRYYVFLASS